MDTQACMPTHYLVTTSLVGAGVRPGALLVEVHPVEVVGRSFHTVTHSSLHLMDIMVMTLTLHVNLLGLLVSGTRALEAPIQRLEETSPFLRMLGPLQIHISRI
jgi:hypothetical protein